METDLLLTLLSDLNEITERLHIKYFVWGGFVQDIIVGKILREHKDIDIFVENLDENRDELIDYFVNKNYQYKYLTFFSMLEITFGGKHVAMNPLLYQGDSAIWKHIGNHGFISFPKNWLNEKEYIFYGKKVRISGVKFEFCFRSMIAGLNPEWKKRDKDVVAQQYYDEIMKLEKIDINETLSKVWSYNPYWQTKGYSGHESPVIVLGKDYINSAISRQK